MASEVVLAESRPQDRYAGPGPSGSIQQADRAGFPARFGPTALAKAKRIKEGLLEGRQILLPDGRRLGYAIFGASAGIPVIYHHGFPACRLEARLVEVQARACGLQLIAIDRPGIGLSDPCPGRTLLDWPKDVARVADDLGIARFATLGVSGGAPAALACVAFLKERLTAAGIVCGLGPVAEPALLSAMRWPARCSFGLAQRGPVLARRLFNGVIGPLLASFPDVTLRLLNVAAPDQDAAVLRDPSIHGQFVDNLREAFRQGSAGPTNELLLLASPWPFSPRDIDFPVQFWHGMLDATVPLGHTEYVASMIPLAKVSLLPNEGHFSLPIRHADSILRSLRTSHREKETR